MILRLIAIAACVCALTSFAGSWSHGWLGQGGGANLREANVFSPSPAINPTAYYNPGVGNPAVSMSDYYGQNGILWSRPYDLLLMGTEGAAIAAREGKRYIWIVAPDHPIGINFQGASDFRVGYSDDPQILPDALTAIYRFNTLVTAGGQTNFTIYQAPWLVYNPDAAGDKFWIYAEGFPTSPARQHEMGLMTTSDFLSTTLVGVNISTSVFGGWSSLGHVYRVGTGNWYALSFGDGSNFRNYQYYTSSDGLSWSLIRQINTVNGSFNFVYNNSLIDATPPCDHVTYNGQLYAVTREQTNNNVSPSSSYITLMPLDSNFNFLSSPAAIRLTDAFNNIYPGPGFLQTAGCYQEDGILHFLVTRGFPTSGSSYALQSGTYAQGGGLWHTFADRYSFVFDSTAALAAAPSGLKASTSLGVVTLTWDGGLPNTTSRVYRAATKTGSFTLIGDVTGTTATDSPPSGYWWYKVVTLSSGVEQNSRTVSAYSNGPTITAFVNSHLKRVIDDGGDFSTCDVSWIVTVSAFLTSNDFMKYLLWWTDPGFCVKQSGGFITKVYDLGTTRLPRGGDYTPCTSNTTPCTTSNTTYAATALNGFAPAWVNGASTAHGYFGNGVFNNLQRKTQITVLAAYQKPGTAKATILSIGENAGMNLKHGAGSPGTITFEMSPSPSNPSAFVSATVAPVGLSTDAHIIAGVFDGVNITAYADGNSGMPIDGSTLANPTLINPSVLRGQYVSTTTNVSFLGSGSEGSKFTYPSTYVFNSNEALFSGGAIAVFEVGMNSTQVGLLTTLYKNRLHQ